MARALVPSARELLLRVGVEDPMPLRALDRAEAWSVEGTGDARALRADALACFAVVEAGCDDEDATTPDAYGVVAGIASLLAPPEGAEFSPAEVCDATHCALRAALALSLPWTEAEGDKASNAPRHRDRLPTGPPMPRIRFLRSTLAVLRAVLLE
jgi:hypothetical protein